MKRGEVAVIIDIDCFKNDRQIDKMQITGTGHYLISSYGFFRTAPIEDAAQKAYLNALQKLTRATASSGPRIIYESEQNAYIQTLAILPVDTNVFTKDEKLMITDKLRSSITNLGMFRVLERDKMRDILMEQKLQLTGCVSDSCRVEVGKLLGVTHILSAQVDRMGSLNYLSLRVIDVESGKIIKYVDTQFSGSKEEIITGGIPGIVNKLSSEFIRKW